MDREKVAKGLERCLSFDPSCGDCPYYSCDDMYNECERNLKNDVLSMLKEHETIIQRLKDIISFNKMTLPEITNFSEIGKLYREE